MVLHIHDNLLISELQERFSKCYPFLKIEFFSKTHDNKEESDTKYIISPDKRIGEIRRNHNEGNFEIKSWYRVDRVEKDLKEKFGLNVQVFGKENRAWVQLPKLISMHFSSRLRWCATQIVLTPPNSMSNWVNMIICNKY